MKTLKELNSKWYWRTLKVIYFLIWLIIIIWSFFWYYDYFHPTSPILTPNIDEAKSKGEYSSQNDIFKFMASKWINDEKSFSALIQEMQSHGYIIEWVNDKGSLWIILKIIWSWITTILWILLFTFIFRSILYYIIFWNPLPME